MKCFRVSEWTTEEHHDAGALKENAKCSSLHLKWHAALVSGANILHKNKAAILIYPFAKLRHLAKEKIITNPEKILELPITARHVFELVEENAEELAKHMGDESPEMLRSAMTTIHQRYEALKVEQQKGWSESLTGYFSSKPEPTPQPRTALVAFGDNNAENELVYGVAVDRYVWALYD